jgi:tetratricopeptide (TPR) repeat protein
VTDTPRNVEGTAGELGAFVLERERRLSQSMLWSLQRRFFEQRSVAAWSDGVVPHYITTNPFIADAYATVLFGWLRDCAGRGRAPGDATAGLDRDQPMYIVELGAGTGRFAFLVLRRLQKLLGKSRLRDVKFKYVLTDFVQRTVDYWREHPQLKPFFEAGVLDFARFDAERERGLSLVLSGETLAPGAVRNPVAVLANYFFDGIAHDAFQIRDGQLFESRVTLASTQPEPDLEDPGILARTTVSFTPHAVEGEYYGDPELDRILAVYRTTLDQTAITFPAGPLRCLQNLAELAGGRVLLISADKGYHREEALLNRGDPSLAIHGSFSLSVNYHALDLFVAQRGGRAMHTSHRHASLDIGAFFLGGGEGEYLETAQAYEEAIERACPDDFFTLKKGLERLYESLTLEQLLAFLRLSGWDPNIFLGALRALLGVMDAATEEARQELYWAVRKVWETYFYIGEKDSLAFYLGLILCKLEYFEEGVQYFERALQQHGPDAEVWFNIGMARYSLRQLSAALASFQKCLEIDAVYPHARAMRVRVQSEIQRAAQ